MHQASVNDFSRVTYCHVPRQKLVTDYRRIAIHKNKVVISGEAPQDIADTRTAHVLLQFYIFAVGNTVDFTVFTLKGIFRSIVGHQYLVGAFQSFSLLLQVGHQFNAHVVIRRNQNGKHILFYGIRSSKLYEVHGFLWHCMMSTWFVLSSIRKRLSLRSLTNQAMRSPLHTTNCLSFSNRFFWQFVR